MGMSNWILENEEMFFDGAHDVIHECDSFDEFLEIMTPQMDLVSHLDSVEDQLAELWNDFWSDVA